MSPFGKIVYSGSSNLGLNSPPQKWWYTLPRWMLSKCSLISFRFWAFFPVAMVTSAQSLTENGSTLAFVDILPPQVNRSTIVIPSPWPGQQTCRAGVAAAEGSGKDLSGNLGWRSYRPIPSSMSKATGKLSTISPTNSALPAESTSPVITLRHVAGAPSGIITSVSCHTCLPRGKSPS